jgi:hypothetical protein
MRYRLSWYGKHWFLCPLQGLHTFWDSEAMNR